MEVVQDDCVQWPVTTYQSNQTHIPTNRHKNYVATPEPATKLG